MLRDIWETHRSALIVIAGALLVALSTVIVVPETEQAVVIRLGEPNRVINRFRPNTEFGSTGAGLTWRIPFMERLVRIDRRILSVDMQSQEVLSTDQLRLQVDAYARYRIIDPVRMVRTAGTTERVGEQLQPIFTSVLAPGTGQTHLPVAAHCRSRRGHGADPPEPRPAGARIRRAGDRRANQAR